MSQSVYPVTREPHPPYRESAMTKVLAVLLLVVAGALVFTVIQRKQLDAVLGIIRRFDERAFYSVDEIQSAEAGIFPAAKGRLRGVVPGVVPHRAA